MHAVTSICLDYCNRLIVNIWKDNVYRLQKVQNMAARLIMGKHYHDSLKLALTKLHWLNVETRINFKVLLILQKVLPGQFSQNLLLKNGRHKDILKLETPSFKTKFGIQGFANDGSRLWNCLPISILKQKMTLNYSRKYWRQPHSMDMRI